MAPYCPHPHYTTISETQAHFGNLPKQAGRTTTTHPPFPKLSEPCVDTTGNGRRHHRQSADRTVGREPWAGLDGDSAVRVAYLLAATMCLWLLIHLAAWDHTNATTAPPPNTGDTPAAVTGGT